MKSVYLVHHSYELDSIEETKFIGVYTTESEANSAVERLRKQPGFKDRPNDFQVVEHELDKDNWTEGYSTLTSIQVKDKKGEWETVHAECLINGTYKIVEYSHEDDSHLEYRGNDIVICEERADGFYAIGLAPKASK